MRRPEGLVLRPTNMTSSLSRSSLIERICESYERNNGKDLTSEDIDLAVRSILDMMATSMSRGERIEVRGFGSFSLHYRKARVGRNPKTGSSVGLSERYVPFFKPGKELRSRVNLRKNPGLD